MRDLVTREFWQAQIPLWRVIIIVLALGTVPGFAAAAVLSGRISDQAHAQLKTSQTQLRAGCQRGNALRRLLNERANAVHDLQLGLIDFMEGAYLARRDPNSPTHDEKLADRYQRDISKVSRVENRQLPIVNCTRAFKFVSADPGNPLEPRAAVVY